MRAGENKEIELFKNEGLGCQVRIVRKDGELWFVAKDVCDALGTATRDVRRILDEDEVQELSNVDSIHIAQATLGGKDPLIISESGLYSLILRSRKEEAKKFRRWVTGEVLPAIRKTGAYSISGSADRASVRKWMKDGEPLGVSDFCVRLRQMGCTLGPRGLMKWLRERGIMDKWPNAGLPTRKAQEDGLAVIANTRMLGLDGGWRVCQVALVTPKGMAHVIADLKRKKLAV